METRPQNKWNLGLILLLTTPFVGLAVALIDFPLWVDIVALVAMIALLFVGSLLLFIKRGGWRPSDTLPKE